MCPGKSGVGDGRGDACCGGACAGKRGGEDAVALRRDLSVFFSFLYYSQAGVYVRPEYIIRNLKWP